MISLPVVVQNSINSYLHHSLPLCAVLSNVENKKWMCGKFINTYSLENSDFLWIDFLEDCHFYDEVAEYQVTSLEQADSVSSIIETIKQSIDEGYYITFFCHRKTLLNYSEIDFPIQLFVYGYDENQHIVQSIGFGNDNLFDKQNYPFENVDKSFQALVSEGNLPYLVKQSFITRMKLKNEHPANTVDANTFHKKFNEYRCGLQGSTPLRDDIVIERGSNALYGINTYDHILKDLANNTLECSSFRYQSAHLLLEHKNHIVNILENIHEQKTFSGSIGSEIQDYRNLAKRFDKLRKMLMFARLKETFWETFYGGLKDKRVRTKMYHHLRESINLERALLNRINEKVEWS